MSSLLLFNRLEIQSVMLVVYFIPGANSSIQFTTEVGRYPFYIKNNLVYTATIVRISYTVSLAAVRQFGSWRQSIQLDPGESPLIGILAAVN